MRPRRKSRLPVAPVRAARAEYLFFPIAAGPHAHQSLSELQQSGWIIKSTSTNHHGDKMLLLSRPKSCPPDKTTVQE